MILKSIHLVNFKKYKKAVITLTNSMIGIFGDNGAGKSSLFEAVTWCLYGVTQSMEGREGVKQQDLIIDGEEEMGVEVEFSLGSHLYKVARYFNAKKGSRSRLWIDGKLQARKSREVATRIEQDLGLNVKGFISSSFIRQKELDLITSKVASERKKLINRLFNLRIYEKFEEAAKNKKKVKENELQVILSRIEEKEKELEQLPGLEKALRELKETVAALESQYNAVQRESESIKMKYTALEKDYKQYQTLESTLKVMEKDVENTESTLKEKNMDLKEIEEAASKKEALTPEYQNFLGKKEKFSLLDKTKSEYDAKMNKLTNIRTEIQITEKNLKERITECKEEIAGLNREEAELKESETILETVRKKIGELEYVPQKREEEIQQLDKIKEKEAGILAEKTKYESRITDLTEELEEIQSMGIGALCPKCKRPLDKEHLDKLITKYTAEIAVHEKAKEKYESKEKHLAEMRKELITKLEDLKKKEKDLNALKKEEQKYAKAETKIEEIKKRIKDLETRTAEHKENLKETEERKKEVLTLKKEIQELEFDPAEYENLKKEVEEKASIEREMINLEARVSKREDVLKSIEDSKIVLATQKEQMNNMKTELETLANIPGEFDAVKKERDQIAEKELTVSKEYTEKKTQYTERTKELEKLHKSEKDLETARKNRKETEDMITVYAVLQDAFKHIPVQIQSRLQPRIRKETSALLNEITEGKYPFIDLGKDYSLTVYYDGVYYPISRFSGGENDLINLCLRVGISRVLLSLSSKKSFARIQSLFLDECFGSFDLERRKNLLAALNQLRKYFAQIILITHIEEIKEALPEAFLVEELEDGSSVIKRIK